ncbi:trp operon repressor [Patescibacteria group bacterium]|nr:trp operon repressor [Patescibacteria group bacterium]MBU4016949.1 trp operon repressor [Patescibacteria group bacterium]MBU4099340.1 trp operon repressor [Patescibacteria group bacterium]
MSSKVFFDELVEEFLRIDSLEDMVDFLYGILTPSEIAEIPKRLQIIKLLKAGVPQKEIASRLRVGIATVTRGSKEVKRGRLRNIKYQISKIKNKFKV